MKRHKIVKLVVIYCLQFFKNNLFACMSEHTSTRVWNVAVALFILVFGAMWRKACLIEPRNALVGTLERQNTSRKRPEKRGGDTICNRCKIILSK